MRRLSALALSASLAGAAPAAAAGQGVETLFACEDAEWAVTLLGTEDGRLLLVTNPKALPGARANYASTWEEIREGRVIGQQGGRQSHIRLFDGIRQIVLFEGVDGELADEPGRTYAGAFTQTEKNPEQDFAIDCEASETNAALARNLTRWAGETGTLPPLPEPEDGPFDGWF